MKIVVAVDSFKGSLSSLEAGEAIKTGIKNVDSQCDVVVKPLADGGEGTIEAIVTEMNGKLHTIEVIGPLGKNITCSYGIIENKKMAIIEIAKVVGLTLVSNDKRNPLFTTTYGIGQVIKDAIKQGCQYFIIGIGGSATNDGGIGMLQALGYEMLDQDGKQVAYGAEGLRQLKTIKDDQILPELKQCQFIIACDVTNPLCGIDGASIVYGPQKGANQQLITEMDRWLNDYALLSKQIYPLSDPFYPGTGAAGGLGFAFLTYLNGRLKSGVESILQILKLDEDLKDADLVITGEGCLDLQTAKGKAPAGVAKLAKKYHLPVIAFAGCVSDDAKICHDIGIDAYFPIIRKVITLQEAMGITVARENLINTVEEVFRLWLIRG